MEKENNIVLKTDDTDFLDDSPVDSKMSKSNEIKSEGETMDSLERIREEERMKLEALKEKEQEKTRLAIENERARLESELAKEIRDLENQLNRAKNASQKVKSRTSVSTGIFDIPQIIVD